MKPYYLLLLVLSVTLSCKIDDRKAVKGSNIVFESKQQGDRPCAGKQGKGLKERTQEQVAATPSDTLVAGHIKQIEMVSRKNSAAKQEIGYRAIYDTGVSWTIMLRPVDGETPGVDAWGYISMPAKHKGDTIIEKILVQDMAALMPGCRRLSQYGSIPFTPRELASSVATAQEYSMILFRGHYDVESSEILN